MDIGEQERVIIVEPLEVPDLDEADPDFEPDIAEPEPVTDDESTEPARKDDR